MSTPDRHSRRFRNGLRIPALLLLGLSLVGLGCEKRQLPLTLAGGPAGGSYQGFAEALARTLSELPGRQLLEVDATGGSVANLVGINRKEYDLGLVYAGDAFLGRTGRLAHVQPATKNVRAVTRLYGAAAQLIIPSSSRFRKPSDLAGARVAIGNPGSGTAIAAERYFTALGLWDQIVPIFVGFEMGMQELQGGQVEALWMVVGFPNRAVKRWFNQYPLRLLPLASGADRAEFWQRYPFYERVTIPAGTYPGQSAAVDSFMDATLLLAGLQVSEAQVYRLLKTLYSEAGLELMRTIHPLGGELRLEQGLQGVRIPLHAGAGRFWKEQGVLAGTD